MTRTLSVLASAMLWLCLPQLQSQTTPQWITVANEGDYLQVPAGTTVRYGAYPSGCFAGGWTTSATYTSDTGLAISNGTFATDPAPGEVKVLQVLEQATAFTVTFDPGTELTKAIPVPAIADGNFTSAPDPGTCVVSTGPPTNGNGNTPPAGLSVGALALNYTLGQSFSDLVPVTGGTGPIIQCAVDKNMPSWLEIHNVNGLCYLAGTPNLTGNYSFTVSVTDSSSPAQTASGTVTSAITSPTGQTAPAGPFTLTLPADSLTLQNCFPWSDTTSGLYGFACKMLPPIVTNPPQ